MIAALVHNRDMYAVIMAGGGGTRLWPLSRARRPKPFLPLLDGGRCLLEATVERLAPLIDADDVYVVTDSRYADLVREVAPGVPEANIIGEPMGRNTAAAVALMAHVVDRSVEDVMVVLPADAAIRDASGFRAALSAAAERASDGDMVTLGVQPTEPSTGYGYVIAHGGAATYAGRETFRVARFEEKPTAERALELVESGSAFWNAGTFVWRRSTLMAGLERYAPDISDPIRDWVASTSSSAGAGWPGEVMADVYGQLRATSIDYALLEPASLEERVAVVPISVGWSDLGSWSALHEYRGRGGRPVISEEAPARVIDVDARDVFVHAAGGRSVAVVGLDDVVIIDTPDALLVSSAEAAQDVKKVVERLKEEGRDDLL
jgi:mannose-1-phosphate guanylyltransferase